MNQWMSARGRRKPMWLVGVCVLLLALAAPMDRAAADATALIRQLNDQLAPSNLGYESRIMSVAETGRGGLAISFWAQRFSARTNLRAGVLADAWRVFRVAFPAGGFPRDIALTAFFPMRDEEGRLTTRVIGHFRLTNDAFQRIDQTDFSPEELFDVGDLALINLEDIDF